MLFLRMILITPATASEAYWAAALSLSTSIWSGTDRDQVDVHRVCAAVVDGTALAGGAVVATFAVDQHQGVRRAQAAVAQRRVTEL